MHTGRGAQGQRSANKTHFMLVPLISECAVLSQWKEVSGSVGAHDGRGGEVQTLTRDCPFSVCKQLCFPVVNVGCVLQWKEVSSGTPLLDQRGGKTSANKTQFIFVTLISEGAALAAPVKSVHISQAA